MRPVGITIVVFVYIWSLSLWFVDATFFAEDPTLSARTVSGQPLNSSLLLEGDTPDRLRSVGEAVANPINNATVLDRISNAVAGGATSTWTLLELLSGTYAFSTLEAVGLHPNFIVVLKAIFPIVAAVTIIFYITGRQ